MTLVTPVCTPDAHSSYTSPCPQRGCKARVVVTWMVGQVNNKAGALRTGEEGEVLFKCPKEWIAAVV